jgi:hypothetical protein
LPQTATLYPALILLNDQTSLSQWNINFGRCSWAHPSQWSTVESGKAYTTASSLVATNMSFMEETVGFTCHFVESTWWEQLNRNLMRPQQNHKETFTPATATYRLLKESLSVQRHTGWYLPFDFIRRPFLFPLTFCGPCTWNQSDFVVFWLYKTRVCSLLLCVWWVL